MERKRIRTVSTSRRTAKATTLVLRVSERTRLVFRPELVENVRDPEASVRGTFAYQRKRSHDHWEDADAINLSTLQCGDGVRLELHAAEVLALYDHVARLYAVADTQGVRRGVRDFVTLPPHKLLDDVATLLEQDSEPKLLRLFLDWLQVQDARRLSKALNDVGVHGLVNFDAAIGVARLRRVVDEMLANRNNGDEGYWQNLFATNSWVLAQLYAHPVIIIQSQVYVGGKTFENRGGTIADFLCRNNLTENAMLVEIKTPATELLSVKPYRNGVYGCSGELVGATQQLLLARQRLIQEGRQLVDEDLPEYRVLSPTGMLLVGRAKTLTSATQRRSFELYRNNLREIDIVSFDELFDKARQLLKLMEGGTS